MSKKLIYVDSSGCTIRLPIDLTFDNLALKYMLELDNDVASGDAQKDLAGVIDKIKYIYATALCNNDKYSNSQGGIISFVKELEMSSTLIDPVLKTLLLDILSAVTTSGKPVFKNYAFLKPNSDVKKVKIEARVDYRSDIKNYEDELTILFRKYHILEVADIILAIKRIGYNVIYNDAIAPETFNRG